MPTAIPNGDWVASVTTSELSAYGAAKFARNTLSGQYEAKPSGASSSEELAIVDVVDQKVESIAQTDWSAIEQQLRQEIVERGALLQVQLVDSVRQWARPGRERALLEMFGVLTAALVDRDRTLLELRERVTVLESA